LWALISDVLVYTSVDAYYMYKMMTESFEAWQEGDREKAKALEVALEQALLVDRMN
jgi:hypothetical protein